MAKRGEAGHRVVVKSGLIPMRHCGCIWIWATEPRLRLRGVLVYKIASMIRTASSLLLVFAFAGLIGVGNGAVASTSSNACGVSCPCENGGHAQALPTEAEATDPGHQNGDPCQGKCPDYCPNCSCCLAVAMAVLPLPETSTSGPCISWPLFTPQNMGPSGFLTDVFRPPRA